jgi:serine protease Do
MKHFPILGLAMVLGGLITAPAICALGSTRDLPGDLGPDFLMYGSQGYLGVDLREIDNDRVNALHLKDGHAAEVVMVDHDAPAGKSGLKVHDVILQLDGQPFDNADQLRRRLRELPAGRTITLLVSRDGNPMNFTVQLCDREVLQQQAWSKHISVPEPGGGSFLGNTAAAGTGFIDNLIPRSLLYVGADVNPVRTQLADYFGVRSGTGLLVESVDDHSPASKAGLKAGDVVVKVESEPMTSRNDWVKAIRNHRGEPVQVTIMRNKQEQILTMSAGKPKKK